MEKDGKYIYCIIDTKLESNFGNIGIGDGSTEVHTVGYEDLSMVVSNHPLTRFVVNQENMMTHQKVIEEVMKEFDSALPVRYGTVATNADEIKDLLSRRYREFKSALRDMKYKVELSVKGTWKYMDVIFREIEAENSDIEKTKEDIQSNPDKVNLPAKMKVGKMVAEALELKQVAEAEKIIDILRKAACNYKINKTSGDNMFLNASFLVDRGREKEFDNLMDDLSEWNNDRVKFIYVGPLPPFNFVNIAIYPEEWEK